MSTPIGKGPVSDSRITKLIDELEKQGQGVATAQKQTDGSYKVQFTSRGSDGKLTTAEFSVRTDDPIGHIADKKNLSNEFCTDVAKFILSQGEKLNGQMVTINASENTLKIGNITVISAGAGPSDLKAWLDGGQPVPAKVETKRESLQSKLAELKSQKTEFIKDLSSDSKKSFLKSLMEKFKAKTPEYVQARQEKAQQIQEKRAHLQELNTEIATLETNLSNRNKSVEKIESIAEGLGLTISGVNIFDEESKVPTH